MPFAHVCAFVQRRQVRYRKGKIASFAEAVKEDWKKEKEEKEAGISSPLRAPPKKDSSSSLAGRFLPFLSPRRSRMHRTAMPSSNACCTTAEASLGRGKRRRKKDLIAARARLVLPPFPLFCLMAAGCTFQNISDKPLRGRGWFFCDPPTRLVCAVGTAAANQFTEIRV